jgi:hypothetical protein
MSVNMQINVQVPDGQYMGCLERLYKIAESYGYKIDERYKVYKNGERTGMMVAVSNMISDMATGKLKPK